MKVLYSNRSNAVLIGLVECVVVLLFLSSCSLVHYLTVDDYNHETKAEYEAFLENCGIEPAFAFQIKQPYRDSLSYNKKFCLNLYKFDRGTPASPIQIRMYDQSGALVMGWSQCYGDLNRLIAFDTVPLQKVKHLPNNYAINLFNDLQMLEASPQELQQVQDYIHSKNYTVLVMFSAWSGWYSKDALKRTQKYAQDHSGIAYVVMNTANYQVADAKE